MDVRQKVFKNVPQAKTLNLQATAYTWKNNNSHSSSILRAEQGQAQSEAPGDTVLRKTKSQLWGEPPFWKGVGVGLFLIERC